MVYLIASVGQLVVYSPNTVSTFVVFKDFPDHACDCFYANERKDRDEAMRHFNLAYATYEKLMPALDDLKNQTRAAGYKAETIIE